MSTDSARSFRTAVFDLVLALQVLVQILLPGILMAAV